MNTPPLLTRRDFTKFGLAAGTVLATGPRALFGATPVASSDKVRLGFIGVGGRGSGLLRTCLQIPNVEIPAICDLLPNNLKKSQDAVEESRGQRPMGFSKNEKDYLNLLKLDQLDAVIIATPWELHIPMAIDAMKAGKYVAMEVGPASSLEECWKLVDTHEKTGVPCMLLENYAFQRSAMAVLNMVRKGLFGELIHCQCGYEHDLRERIVKGKGTGITLPEGGDFRTHHNRTRNGDIYPTHGLGPMAHCLNIHRGNRFVSLTSTASKSRGLNTWAEKNLGPNDPETKRKWAIGDIVTTVIKCENGETVIVNHDVTLPRPMHHMCRVQGTKGIWERSLNSIYIDGLSPKEHTWEPFDKYLTEYEHPMWKEYLKSGIKQGHWGTDYLTLNAFAQCAKNKRPVPIDVYDAAAWRAVSPLSERSIADGNKPIEFPDFTRGKWKTNPPIFGMDA